MSRLLHKPFKVFTLYASVILLCSIPVYYTVVNAIWLDELDEHNRIIKDKITNRLKAVKIDPVEMDRTLELWSALQPGTKLTAGSSTNDRDSIYTLTRENEYITGEIDRFRGLSTTINVNAKPYHLQVETNVEEVDETMLAIGTVTLVFFVLLVAGFVLLNRRIAKGLWQPFYQTLEKLRAFNLETDHPVAFNKTTIAEFDELHQVLYKLIESNVTAFRQQKKFIENASHELQTPLAVLVSKTDLFLQNKDLTSEQAEILNTLQRHLAKVTRVNKNLLLLARIENSQFAGSETLNVMNILNENISLLDDYISNRKLTLRAPEKPLIVHCNKFLLETLLNNLLINAIKHSPSGSALLIELSERTLSFLNAGSNELNKRLLFERFSNVSNDTVSSGLGLAIVKEICNRYKWQIDYTYRVDLHCFSITF